MFLCTDFSQLFLFFQTCRIQKLHPITLCKVSWLDNAIRISSVTFQTGKSFKYKCKLNNMSNLFLYFQSCSSMACKCTHVSQITEIQLYLNAAPSAVRAVEQRWCGQGPRGFYYAKNSKQVLQPGMDPVLLWLLLIILFFLLSVPFTISDTMYYDYT